MDQRPLLLLARRSRAGIYLYVMVLVHGHGDTLGMVACRSETPALDPELAAVRW